jgi:hypothetical protein
MLFKPSDCAPCNIFFDSPLKLANRDILLARRYEQMDVLRHDNPGPNVHRPSGASFLQGLHELLPYTIAGQEREPVVATECQLARRELAVVSTAQFSNDNAATL